MPRNESGDHEPSSSLRMRHEREARRGGSFVLSRDAVREVDRAAIEEYGIAGIVLMENAARGLAEAAIDMLERAGVRCQVSSARAGSPDTYHLTPDTCRVLIVCGGGNNGGDGCALARHLHNAGVAVTIMMLADPKADSDAATNREICLRMKIPERSPAALDSIGDERFDLIVDAIFGTGLDRPISGTPREVIEWINGRRSPVLAVDVPSGLDCETGEIHGVCVKASMTCTFVALKPAFQRLETQRWLGEVRVVDIGVPRELIERHGHRLPAPPPGVEDARRGVQETSRAADR